MANSTIADSYVRQFRDALELECQQMASALRMGVTETQVVGKDFSVERVKNPSDLMDVVTGRDEDTVLSDMNHSRRIGIPVSYRNAVSINEEDILRILIDPKSAYVMELAGQFNRTVDQKLIAAILGNAAAGETGASSVALGSAQQITSSGSTDYMSLAKLQQGQMILLQGFVDLDREDVKFFCNAAVYRRLSQDAGVTSILQVDQKVNVTGKLGQLAGFDIMRCEALTSATGTYTGAALSSTSRPGILMAKSAVALGFSQDMKVFVENRPDKWGLNQVRMHATFGAVRVHEPKVVDIRSAE